MHWLRGTWLWLRCKYEPLTTLSTVSSRLLTLSLGTYRTRVLGIDAYTEREAGIHSDWMNTQTMRHLEFENDLFSGRPVPIEPSPVRRPARTPATPTRQFRCKRCNGLRSSRYHRQYYSDPMTYPSVGICSRRRTCCAAVKTALQMQDGCRQIAELPANELGWAFNT